jgi:hypothetical protein
MAERGIVQFGAEQGGARRAAKPANYKASKPAKQGKLVKPEYSEELAKPG